MRLTIFWRIILAQLTLIWLILAVSLYAGAQLTWLTSFSTHILATDSSAIEAEKQLLQTFLAQMRNAEKYLLLQDKAFYDHFQQGNRDFLNTLSKLTALVDSPLQRAWLDQVQSLHAQYVAGLTGSAEQRRRWREERATLSEKITTQINDLIRYGERAVTDKTAIARDRAAFAATMVRWLTYGVIGLAVMFTYVHARSISRPLKRLTQALLGVGKGEFQRSLHIGGPKEVSELATAFNWMAERLAELDQMKTDFIAHVSHELRTPLTGIQEGTFLLLDNTPDPITPAQREIVEIIQDYSERLHGSISSLLDLAKLEAGMMEYHKVPTDLAALIARSVQSIRLIAQTKGIHLEVTCPTPLPLLAIDEERMQQVLTNLLSNAVKFTPSAGRVEVSAVLTEKDEERPAWVEIRVADTGIGIPPEEAEKIFDRFYQGPHHQEGSQRGTGLGLAIARHIVEAHHGQLWVESQGTGCGSVFVCMLPVHEHSAVAVVTRPDGGEDVAG
jgi:two-component system sensor histidine kinase GlrK